ncbi:hypothetical protein K435DRAFT_880662 [Dendrothele bispora CBS 962.96]|uniref:Uncharacterized protein n=1 Tax=Dendrothele bispora (strain CBS 962.96) TaxID=1314807 RepID=A0A4S8KJ73_DENBC|nr:hypothetical protein K435DRAFT_880662 [Dendrothele bispora CBS 962.96]
MATTTFVCVPMPIPGAPGAPVFNGDRASDFLVLLEQLGTQAGITDKDNLVEWIVRYSTIDVYVTESDPNRKENKEESNAYIEEESDEAGWAAIVIDEDFSDIPEIDCSDLAESALSATTSNTSILFDSGCTSHMTPLCEELENFHSIVPCKGTLQIEVPIDCEDHTRMLTLRDALLCPTMLNTLVSIGKLDDAGYEIHIQHGIMEILDGKGRIIASIPKINGLYQILSSEHAYATQEKPVSLRAC